MIRTNKNNRKEIKKILMNNDQLLISTIEECFLYCSETADLIFKYGPDDSKDYLRWKTFVRGFERMGYLEFELQPIIIKELPENNERLYEIIDRGIDYYVFMDMVKDNLKMMIKYDKNILIDYFMKFITNRTYDIYIALKHANKEGLYMFESINAYL